MQAVIHLKHISINFFKVAEHKCLISNFENCLGVGSFSYFLTGFVLWSTVISVKLIKAKPYMFPTLSKGQIFRSISI